MGTDKIATLFRYKRWIDIETLQAIGRINASANAEKRHLTLRTMTECTDWYIQHVNSMSPVDLAETIKFQFVDGGPGEMKAVDMLNHVLFHGTYHRGAVGWLLSESGVTPPKDVLTVFLRDHNHE